MTPGDIATLAQSDELAFRVSFKGRRPAQHELYWRGLVLGHFDGTTWTQFAKNPDIETTKARLVSSPKEAKQRLTLKGEAIQYDIIYETSGQPWLFSLSPVVAIKYSAALYGNDFRIMAKDDLLEPLRLQLTSYPNALRAMTLSASEKRLALQLPDNQNPKTQQFVKQRLESSTSTQDFIQKVLNRYQNASFYYTLRPPTLDRHDSIDDFLFNSQKGFCAHYAGSFVYMMRSVGIPARVVVGYQGGAWNEKGEYLAVYQYDAHAWTEIWLKNKGWIRIDPTAMIAPERIETNLQSAMQKEGSFLEHQFLSSAKYQWLQGIRKQMDSTQYNWRKFVLGYDQNAQSNLIKTLFGNLSMLKIAWLIGGFFVALLFLWSLLLGLTKKHQTEAIEHQLYRRFCDLLEKRGIQRKISQSPTEYSRIAMNQLPELSVEIQRFSTIYSTLCYEDRASQNKKALIATLKRLVKVIKHK
jgi:transglutaminase-like putative cysteine protease